MSEFDIPTESKARQCARLLEALRSHTTITTDDAREYLGIPHVAGRIKDLRDSGYTIETRMAWVRDHNEYRRRLAHYTLVEVCHEQ